MLDFEFGNDYENNDGGEYENNSEYEPGVLD